MAKKFYTERDIEDIASRGVLSLNMDSDTVLTELAYEKAQKLGVSLTQPNQIPPAAPVRPYLSAEQAQKPCSCSEQASPTDDQMRQRIRDAVKAKLGTQIDPTLLETIITRVLNNVGIK